MDIGWDVVLVMWGFSRLCLSPFFSQGNTAAN